MKKPRICAVGILSDKFEAQIETLMKQFKARRLTPLIFTRKKGRINQVWDVVSSLYMNRMDFDVIHIQSHSYKNIILLAIVLFMGRVLRKKVVVMYYGGAAHEFFNTWPRIIRRIFCYPNEIIVAGKYVQRAFDKINIKTNIIPHILDVDSWSFRQRDKPALNFLWVRHLRSEYNPLMVLELFKRFSLNAGGKLSIVGEGPFKSKMDAYILKNQLSSVCLLGRVSAVELRNLLDEADFFINTTNVDNQPVSVLEAMACGVPVISTNVGGIPDIIKNERNGMLSDPGNIDQMEENIRYLLERSDLYMNISTAGREFIEKTFSNDKILREWNEIYRKIGFQLFSEVRNMESKNCVLEPS